MKILITGNAGYIGSHLTKLLNKRTDLELYGLDRNKPQLPVKEQARNDITMPGYFPWQHDFEFDCVIHLAAEVAVGRSVTNPIVYYQTNTMGTLRVLQDLKYKRFVHASTGSAGPMNNLTISGYRNHVGFECRVHKCFQLSALHNSDFIEVFESGKVV